MKFSGFPALSESAFLRYLTFSALYVAQGIPFGLLWFGLPAWMAMNGKSCRNWLNLFTIFQDIAVDGLAIDIVPENQQARANGLMWGSKTLALTQTLLPASWECLSPGR